MSTSITLPCSDMGVIYVTCYVCPSKHNNPWYADNPNFFCRDIRTVVSRFDMMNASDASGQNLMACFDMMNASDARGQNITAKTIRYSNMILI